MKSEGFILSEHLIGLGILALGITFYVITLHALLDAHTRMEEQVKSARICKEYLATKTYANDDGYRVSASKGQISVSHGNRKIVELKKDEA